MAKEKSGRISFRTTPELHRRLAAVADSMGIGVNDLLNVLVQIQLRPFEALTNPGHGANMRYLQEMWQIYNPGEDPIWFWWDLHRMLWLEKPLQFKNGKWYVLDETRNDFDKVRSPIFGTPLYSDEIGSLLEKLMALFEEIKKKQDADVKERTPDGTQE
jgi:hypothetical protein